jgi:hypothetical protein
MSASPHDSRFILNLDVKSPPQWFPQLTPSQIPVEADWAVKHSNLDLLVKPAFDLRRKNLVDTQDPMITSDGAFSVLLVTPTAPAAWAVGALVSWWVDDLRTAAAVEDIFPEEVSNLDWEVEY